MVVGTIGHTGTGIKVHGDCFEEMITDMTLAWNADRTRVGIRPVGSEEGTPFIAFADVRLRDDTLVVLHTETDTEHRGEGLAARLTRELLDQARTKGWWVDPRCPYTARWLERHPEYSDLVVTQG